MAAFPLPSGPPGTPPPPPSGPPAALPWAALALLVALAAGAIALAAGPAGAEAITLDLGPGESLATRTIQILALVTLLSLVPGLAIMVTCFPFIVTVLAILRQAIGLMQSPPNMLIVSLALFLTWFVMEPVFTAAWEAGGRPFVAGEAGAEEAFLAAAVPFRGFMAARLDPETFAALAALRPDAAGLAPGAEAPLSVLVPAFLLSEVARAFEVGFLVFLPFLVIDLVVAAVLMSMGMMMVPPAVVALPFKLAFFVVADGWGLISAALVRSYF
ncbi:MAG: flagellar type III secretion system pore protein FliP [Rhodobacteraceae bacterium]|nr:flagellar type III secretion system pore protein FliP [Paracoccaceae bacterium]